MKRSLLTACYVLCLSLLTFAQTRQLTGKVIGPDNQGVVSTTVRVKGTSNVTTTNADGVFSIKAPMGAFTLEISSVGFASKEVAVRADESNVIISLSTDATQLQDVVVTALGISKQSRKLGYAVTTIGNEALSQARESNVGNSLSGRVAGLKVAGTSSGPQGTVKLLLRGNPSMNSSGAPLIVINGIPMDNTQRGGAGEWGGGDNGDGIGNLNPDDIASMTVLKGQSASALYGSRASNGVILITTKSAKRNEFSLEYNMNFMQERPVDFTDWQYEYGQGTGGVKPSTPLVAQATGRKSWGSKLDGLRTIQFDGNSYPYSAAKNNVRNFYRNGPSLTNTISLAKGGESGSFRLSVSNLGTDGVMRNNSLKRNTINLNAQQDITSKFSVSVFATYLEQNSKGIPFMSDGPLNANNGYFLANNIDQSVLNPGYDLVTGNEVQFSDDEYVSNPWFVVNQFVNDLGRKRLTAATTFKYQFESWLYAQARVGLDQLNDRSKSVTPWGTAYSFQRRGGLNGQGLADRSEFNIDGLVGASHTIVGDLSFDAAVGANMRKNRYEATSVSGSPFILPYLYSWNNVSNFGRSYDYWSSRVHSAYYTADFSLGKVLTIGTTGRYDAYSTLPKDNNTIFVPSVTGSFIFSELFNSSVISYGKLRASYAKTSNELTNPYQTQVYYNLGSTYLGNPVGTFPTNLPSGLLKPFTTSEVEVGAEMKFFNNRAGIDIAIFNKKTKNEIMGAAYSITSGYTSGYVPYGSVENKGLELQLNGTPIKNKNFSWNTTFNLTTVKNKVIKTDPNNNNLNLGTNRGSLWSAYTAYVPGESGPQLLAYDYKYSSKGEMVVDEFGIPVRGELRPFGGVLPTLYGGWNNEFSYKSLTFSFLIDYNFGNKILSATSYYATLRGLHKRTLVGREGGVTTGVDESGAANTVAADAELYYSELSKRISSIHVLNGDFIKLRQVSIGYTLPASIVGKLKIIENINVSLVGRNILVLMKKSDNIDPEATFGSSINYFGIEGSNLPSTRSFGVNVNIKFKK